MRRLLALMIFAVSLGASAQNQNFDPDFNGDGCFTAEDFLSILTIYGSCDADTGHTIYFFRNQSLTWPFYSNGYQFDDEQGIWYLWADNDSGYVETSDLGSVFQWTLENQGFVDDDGYSVLPIDSITNVTVPLNESIPDGTIVFPEGVGYYWFLIPRAIDFPFYDVPAFYVPGVNLSSPSLLVGIEFSWQGEVWDLLRPVDFLPASQGNTFNVFCDN